MLYTKDLNVVALHNNKIKTDISCEFCDTVALAYLKKSGTFTVFGLHENADDKDGRYLPDDLESHKDTLTYCPTIVDFIEEYQNLIQNK